MDKRVSVMMNDGEGDGESEVEADKVGWWCQRADMRRRHRRETKAEGAAEGEGLTAAAAGRKKTAREGLAATPPLTFPA